MDIIYSTKMNTVNINRFISNSEKECVVKSCSDQNYIASGMSEKDIIITGTPGKELGAYLNGANITLFGDAPDKTGARMLNGQLVIHGSTGDMTGFAMEGGSIFIKENSGIKTGYNIQENLYTSPTIVIGGKTGSFLGAGQKGGTIIVLGLNCYTNIIGNYPCVNMEKGRIYVRTNLSKLTLPNNVKANSASPNDMQKIRRYLEDFSSFFDIDLDYILNSPYTIISPIE